MSGFNISWAMPSTSTSTSMTTYYAAAAASESRPESPISTLTPPYNPSGLNGSLESEYTDMGAIEASFNHATPLKEKKIRVIPTSDEVFTSAASWAKEVIGDKPCEKVSIKTLIEMEKNGKLEEFVYEKYEKLNALDSSKSLPNRKARKLNREILNRWPDIFPADGNILWLDIPKTHTFAGKKHYHNASPVKLFDQKYILAQAPKYETISDFFRVVRNHGVKTIIILTMPTEVSQDGKTRIKAMEYIHAHIDNEHDVYRFEDPISYKNMGEETTLSQGTHTAQKLTLGKLIVADREVRVLHLKDWPDFGVCEISLLSDLVDATHDEEAPLLTHCSAGLGRSGCYALAHAIRTFIHTDAGELPLDEMFLSLRACRPGAIQKKEQFLAAVQAAIYPFLR